MEQIKHLSTHLHDEAAVVFWANVGPPDPLNDGLMLDCTEWRGAYDGAGIPAHLCAGQYVYAPVYALLTTGHDQWNGRRWFTHTCDNRRCVYPGHLLWAHDPYAEETP